LNIHYKPSSCPHYSIKMNPKVYFALALVACTCNSALAIFASSIGLSSSSVGSGLALGGTVNGAAVGSTALVSGTGLLLGAGLVGLKVLAVASVLGSANRGKRSTDESDLAFIPIAVSEPEACYKRFICDLATGSMPQSENDVIISLFNKPVSADSPKAAFQQAAVFGKVSRQVRQCEVRYSCPLSGAQIQKLFN
jgi:hypothetical protein